MIVKHNITAMNSNRMLGLTTSSQAKSTEKLSSGYKINRAADDAAGLAISEKMRRQVRGLTQASANAQDGISAVQTAEGALNEVQDMLQRMNELSIKAGNGTMSESDRQSVQDEIDQLITEIDRVSETTKFNETYLLKGEGKSGSNSMKAGATISDVNGGSTVDGKLIKATGNIYENTFDSVASTMLAEGTKVTATVTYLDGDGKRREKEVEFEAGKDEKGSAENFAEAINKDDTLKKIFKASSDGEGKIVIESKLNGNKTDGNKNKIAADGITFKNSAGAARIMKMGTAKVTDAKQDGYEMVLGTSTTAGAGAISGAASKFIDGSSIVINGETYTYDSAKAAANSENSFKTISDLAGLLGDDYELEIFASAVDSTTGAVMSQLVPGSDATIGAKQLDKLAIGDFSDITEANVKGGTAGFGIRITQKADIGIEDTLNFSLQVGADTTAENKIDVDIVSMSAKSLGIDGLSVTGKDSANADAAVDTIADAIAKVSKQRSALGAVQNRLEHTINNLDNVVENTQSAEAAIRDTDIAEEMVKYSNNNILQQAGTSMLSQANQSNQLALSLLG